MGFKIFDLGLIDYQSALERQKEIFLQVKNLNIDSALIFCRHYPVISLGRAAKCGNILASQEELMSRQIKLCRVERGGDVTYHGPGQITVYPIVNLNYFKKDIHWFLRELEGVIIDSLSDFGIIGFRRPGFTGVWIGQEKIASIGIAVRNWITFHGLSLNVKKDDLDNFSLIRPCGADIVMIAMEKESDREIDFESVKDNIIAQFSRFFYFCPLPKRSKISFALAQKSFSQASG